MPHDSINRCRTAGEAVLGFRFDTACPNLANGGLNRGLDLTRGALRCPLHPYKLTLMSVMKFVDT